MKKYRISKILGAFVMLTLAGILICDQLVTRNADGLCYDSTEQVPETEVGLLLGTTPITRIGGRKNAFFKYRIEAAASLYHGGKVHMILISGDEDSLEGINEPEAMRDSLIVRGVPCDSILLDGKGFRTINSVINARILYDFDSFTIISQQFHNERALYLATHLDLDLKQVYAYNAKSPHSTLSIMTYLREYLARVKMFVDLFKSIEDKE